MPFVHRNVTDTTATIRVPGLHKRLRVLHVSDSHVDVGGLERKDNASAFMHGVYAHGAADRSTGVVTLASDALYNSLSVGRERGADVLCHTGDLVNFPSAAAVRHVDALISEAKLPLLYTSGNHDWE